METAEPQVEDEITQHTPNPKAQDPLAVPDLLVHSEEVKHVPREEEEPLLVLVHSSFGKWTMLNSGICSKHIIVTKNLKAKSRNLERNDFCLK